MEKVDGLMGHFDRFSNNKRRDESQIGNGP